MCISKGIFWNVLSVQSATNFYRITPNTFNHLLSQALLLDMYNVASCTLACFRSKCKRFSYASRRTVIRSIFREGTAEKRVDLAMNYATAKSGAAFLLAVMERGWEREGQGGIQKEIPPTSPSTLFYEAAIGVMHSICNASSRTFSQHTCRMPGAGITIKC